MNWEKRYKLLTVGDKVKFSYLPTNPCRDWTDNKNNIGIITKIKEIIRPNDFNVSVDWNYFDGQTMKSSCIPEKYLEKV